MSNKISLYIADQLVDLDDNSLILFNYTMEDLRNPTIVRNSFSKQVTLKGTPSNNKIFGHFARLDRQTAYGASASGVNFSSIRKTPFAIYNEGGEVVESGYVKLDEVKRELNRVEYMVTLYGGLGSFFYELMYRKDGLKRTLYDLRYSDLENSDLSPGDLSDRDGWVSLMAAWDFLKNPADYDPQRCLWCNIINFAPCYNGLPEGFSADKAVCNNPYENIPNYEYLQNPDKTAPDLHMFSFKEGTSSNLMVMSNPHTEWEMLDLRWYLQRPVISVKAIIEAIQNDKDYGGYVVELDDDFFNDSNPYYVNAWITLSMIAIDTRHDSDAITKLLKSSLSPAEYLISFAKIFGLIFLCDSAEKKVTIMQRKNFFRADEMIDLTDRIDKASINIKPVLAESGFYQFGGEVLGEWAESYKADYNRDYGIQMVNTGNEFSQEVVRATDGIVFKDAVEVSERNLLFFSNDLTRDEMGGVVEYMSLPRYESVKLQLWGNWVDNDASAEQIMQEVDVIPSAQSRFPFNAAYPLADFLPKPQFHGAENKVSDGANVLLFFNGMASTPEWGGVYGSLAYRVTDDTPDMDTLNQGSPCWNLSRTNSQYYSELPSFRRNMTQVIDGKETITESFEWGVPLARGVPGLVHEAEPATLYNLWWRRYQRDRFDDDTYRVTCKVNLSGLRVDQWLLGRFFYYEGSVFVINAIRNHPLTTKAFTECELIRVQDIDNYINR